MVAKISEVAAKSGNGKVFKWALRNGFCKDDESDVFIEAAENEHIKILEIADRKELDWYHREILVGAAARTDLDVLLFLFKKKPNEFNLGFTRMCACKGYIEVMEWWKETELRELFIGAANCGQLKMLDKLYENEYQQASSDLKEFLNGSIVNWAVIGGQIDVLEWAWDQGIHGDADCLLHAKVTCMCCNGSERMC